ncbi:pyridoxal phosphate-dependent aminotransferase [Halopenitus persicus]|uniref:Aspartate aminotransferase/aminotransferase n=1 Tax=Halopenitus persicus TaxID=1048396 RepID=A0A1H3P3U3_9EURY|nr:aminotransferase class I/II-fold pyridoxal phosphate-dependent enzyme [Halopenitus persicus]SDY95721.1 aspartate aminotransferase/aminotransferase [Halopenitus persicus]
MAAAVSEQTKLLVVDSPQNPTGSVLLHEFPEEIRDFPVEHDLFVISDESYEKIPFNSATHHSLATLDGMGKQMITVNGVSKVYSMRYFQLGYPDAPLNLIDPILRVRQYIRTCAPSLSQWSAVEVIERTPTARSSRCLPTGASASSNAPDAIDEMTCPDSTGVFYVLPTIPDGFNEEDEFVWSLLRDAGVALVPGTVFRDIGERCVRIAYSNYLDRIDEAFDRLETWL